MSEQVEKLAHTLEWCADSGSVQGLHPPMVREAAALLRKQAQQIAEMERILAANTPTVTFDERQGAHPYKTARYFTFVAALPQAYYIETEHDAYSPYPIEIEARHAVSMFARQFEEALMPIAAQAIEARRAETTGSARESAVRQDAPNPNPGATNEG